jgi:hypothetical protein
MQDDRFRPLIRTLADAIAVAENNFGPVSTLRGGTGKLQDWGGSDGALTWIDGETECEHFRVAIPVARRFSGRDENGRFREMPITAFNRTTIRPDGSLQLPDETWLRGIKFELTPLTHVLTDLQHRIAQLISAYLNTLGRSFPTNYIAYARLAAHEEPLKLEAVVKFVRSRWPDGERPPSRETIATTLEALWMRPRSRPEL